VQEKHIVKLMLISWMLNLVLLEMMVLLLVLLFWLVTSSMWLMLVILGLSYRREEKVLVADVNAISSCQTNCR
jgi:hypothetical protein